MFMALVGVSADRRRARDTVAIALAMALVVTISGVGVREATAHCPFLPGEYGYAIGTRGLSSTAEGVQATIEYANPNPCSNQSGDAFSAERITLGRTGSMDGWVQVGWIRREYWAAPILFCEFTPRSSGGTGTWHVHDATQGLPVQDNSFQFVVRHDESGDYWECSMNGSPKFHTHTTGYLGWSHGTGLEGGGEAYARHATIGQVAPSKLDLTAIKHKLASGWVLTTYQNTGPNGIYESAVPAAGRLQNWTDGNH